MGNLACLLVRRGNPLCPYLSAFMKKTVVNETIAVSGETVSHSLPVLSSDRLASNKCDGVRLLKVI